MDRIEGRPRCPIARHAGRVRRLSTLPRFGGALFANGGTHALRGVVRGNAARFGGGLVSLGVQTTMSGTLVAGQARGGNLQRIGGRLTVARTLLGSGTGQAPSLRCRAVPQLLRRPVLTASPASRPGPT